MIALYIIGGIVLLFILMGQLRVRVYATFGDALSVFAKIGPVKMQLIPAPKKELKPKQKTAPAKETAPKPQTEKQKLTFEDIGILLPAVGKGLRNMARKTRKRLRIDPLDLSIIAGGDPADAAKLYGVLNNAVFTGMPLLESVFHIPDPRIHLDMDCNAEKTRVYGAAGFYLRICDGMAIGMALIMPLAKWFIQWKKKPTPLPNAEQEETNDYEKGIMT